MPHIFLYNQNFENQGYSYSGAFENFGNQDDCYSGAFGLTIIREHQTNVSEVTLG